MGYCEGVGLGVDGGDHESYNKIKLSKGGKIYIFFIFLFIYNQHIFTTTLIALNSFPGYPNILYII